MSKITIVFKNGLVVTWKPIEYDYYIYEDRVLTICKSDDRKAMYNFDCIVSIVFEEC